MSQRLIVCTNSAGLPSTAATAEQRNQITALLKNKEWEVWHWFEDLWLVVVHNYSASTKDLREEISLILGPSKYVLILDVSGSITYSGMGNAAGWPWMATHWGSPK
jgi:hypothetical protein